MDRLANETLDRIHHLLPIWETQNFRNLCHRNHAVLPLHPRIRPVLDSIRPFFRDAEKFRERCLRQFSCLIAGIIPFLTMAGLPIGGSDILDLYVTAEDASPLCTSLEDLGCQFFVQRDGTLPSSKLLSSSNKYFDNLAESDWDRKGLPPVFSPPSACNIVIEEVGFPGPPSLGSTAAREGGIDQTLIILPVLTPEGRWLRVHVLRSGRPVMECIYLMPSTAYLHFIDHKQIFSFSMSLTFIAGLHVPFNTHLTFTPIPWPPPFSFRCVADQLSYLPYRRITGQGLRQQVWTKPWEVDGRESLVNPRSPDQNDRPYSQVDFEIVNMTSEMGWQTVDGEDPNLDILELYSHPEMLRTTSREISYETELDIRIKPTGGWW